ncbi:cupin domain-containing protein [Burkholderia pseudomultivorans]|uniref:50S ribosomal protein L16 3-hydroxylase n=1 Tax=Burkholderia pseudomultivorans TaxID=1207504 RepID=A0ABU2EBU1_9BURK|nr:cupin domain-containing protein [Burkholderia pseudomultivorans]MDR8729814.1 50S ribosomal protein L16 3-hydroxylase [Burkholderia pseudomultivorans]MDR8737836.1 50S ribosomal protein L16 3-hydroxylase [Burkholderia pseudomultivorans]MDR8744040.1 50S ribosomal protein L16 3-hydroxylase [Burkholderia pseudomultivorans]MDR8757342.1 50S ribosomal protein L16 3-hydroxylase [Burkholderia pseudomultivorans]MDR8780490.1 50S ribosomal protein L16 3-hydroxylase [Burkholderia pseudomultivorans]
MRNRSQAEPRDAAAAPFGALPPDLPTPLLGGLTPAQFMRRYWQKKPLLIRQAMPGVKPPVTRDALFELAADYDAESRLITHFRNKWQLAHGPFEPGALPATTRKAWTLLVQGLDLHVDAARALLDRFRFIPDARLDDLMISYATDGGGVGPHFDSYDVFLLQVEGRRRWRIGAQKDLSLLPDVPLKILEHFEPSEEWLLEPGDMLYLPPHIAHDGVAEGECMTCSIGFRAPSAGELGAQFLYYLAERGGLRERVGDDLYRDPKQPAVDTPAQLPPAMVERVAEIVDAIRWRKRDIAEFLGCYLSEPKPNVVFDPPARPLSEAAFVAQASRRGVCLDRRAALLYNARSYFISGEEGPLEQADEWLPELANQRQMEAKRFVTLSRVPSMTALLHEWYRAGWIRVGSRN